MRAVDLVDLLAVKKLTAQRRARTGLLRALKEQEHAAPDRLPLEHQRDAAQRRGMSVVTAQVRRAALGRRQRVVICAQRDRGLCALRLTVRGVEAARKLMKLQRGMLAQEGQQGVLCHGLAAGDLRAGVELCAAVGEKVTKGQPLFKAYAQDESKLQAGLVLPESIIVVSETEPEHQPHIYGRVGGLE